MTIYGLAAAFRAYHEARGRNMDAYSDDTVVDAAGLVASEWLDATYRRSFTGYKVGGREQAREWPRYCAYDIDGKAISSDNVPVEIEYATYEAQLRELQSAGSLTTDYTPNKYKSVSIAGAVSVDYAMFNGAADAQVQILIVDRILSSLLLQETSSVSGSVQRA